MASFLRSLPTPVRASIPLLLGAAGPSFGLVTVTDHGLTTPTLTADDTGFTGTSNQRFGWDVESFSQSFTLADAGTLGSIYLGYNAFEDGDTLTFDLFVNDDLVQGGIVLDGNNFSGAAGDNNDGPFYWMEFDLSSLNVPLEAGTNSFKMTATANTGNSWALAPRYHLSASSYPGGELGGLPTTGDLAFAVTVLRPDVDGDGLTDDYELANTDPPSATALVPGEDDDGDGMTNEQEFHGQDSLGEVHGFGRTMASLADTDADGIDDEEELSGAQNPYQVGHFPGDAPGGAPGQATNPNDPDSDDDGILDGEEVSSGTDGFITNPNDDDTDGDTLGDEWEASNDIDPTDDGSGDIDNGDAGDPDMDSLDNGTEFALGTNPRNGDTDDDGYGDEVEDEFGSWASAGATGTDPLNPDTDGDGLLDGEENPDSGTPGGPVHASDPNDFDSDFDLYGDGDEVAQGSDPTSDTSVPTGSPFRQVGFADATGGWQIAAGVSAGAGSELLPGSGDYVLIDGSSSGNGLRIEHANPSLTALPAGTFHCSVDLRVEGELTGAGSFNILASGAQVTNSDAATHCILRLFGDGSVQAYDGSAFQPVVPVGGIVAGTTYTAQIDHNLTGGTWDARVYDRTSGALVGSISGVTVRPTSDPNAEPLYFTVGVQPPAQNSWDVAVDNMIESLDPIVVDVPDSLRVLSAGFNGGAFEVNVEGFDTGKMYVLRRSTDLQTFADVGTPFTPAASTDTVSDPSPEGPAAFYRIEEAP